MCWKKDTDVAQKHYVAIPLHSGTITQYICKYKHTLFKINDIVVVKV